MDLQVPLNKLKFGQDDGAGINARVAGRQDGIAELAANLHAQGQIENLIVKDAGDGFYSVANGNRRLAAFHMIHGADSSQPINCTLHDVDETRAFEMSLTTAITAAQLHPVDQYEAFARLEERGKTHEEIARQYGMTEKEVRQALALGRLSPKIRQAWRDGLIKAEVAKAFTLALDHKTQDKAFAKLEKDHSLGSDHYVKEALGVKGDREVLQLIDFVGAEAYRGRGGQLTEDLFGHSHIISDEALLKTMAREKLDDVCRSLLEAGWGWAGVEADLPRGAAHWPQSKPKELRYEGNEEERMREIGDELNAIDNAEDYTIEAGERQEVLENELESIEAAARSRSFEPKKMKQLGCIVDVDEGRLVVLYGVKKPEEARITTSETGAAVKDEKPAPKKTDVSPVEADEEDISNALNERLAIQLTKAAATALIQDEQLALSVLLAGFGCYDDCGIKVHASGLGSRGERSLLGAEEMTRALPLAQKLTGAQRVSMLAQVAAMALDFKGSKLDAGDKHDQPFAIVNAINPKMFNAAARGAFDAKDYFGAVSKVLCLKAIEEAMGPDIARQQGKAGKPEIVAFAIENVPSTGWLPFQLRCKGYDGPPVAKGKVLALPAAKGKAKPPAKKAAPAKRAAAAKKATKKTSKKNPASRAALRRTGR